MMDQDGASAQRRYEILQAAGAVFTEMGFQKATTAEIAKRAKTSKRSIYALFGSKDGLLEALIKDRTQLMTAPFELPAPTGVEAFEAILQSFAGHFLDQLLDAGTVAIHRIVIAEAPQNPALGRMLESHGRAVTAEAAQRFFESAAGAGLIDEADISTALKAFFCVLITPLQLQVLLGQQAWPDVTVKLERVTLAIAVVRRFLKKRLNTADFR